MFISTLDTTRTWLHRHRRKEMKFELNAQDCTYRVKTIKQANIAIYRTNNLSTSLWILWLLAIVPAKSKIPTKNLERVKKAIGMSKHTTRGSSTKVVS